jgi:shikimate kinase / 3-dehydroquinate synthase
VERPLLLNGFMATGKSTVGRLLAAKLNRRFVDLDERLTVRFGSSIPEFFARSGEAAFRVQEAAELERVLGEEPGGPAPIVALGAGALLSRERRLTALDRAVVVTLTATPAEIARRAGTVSGRPLLDADNVELRATELLTQRALAYAEAHAAVSTEGNAPERIADAVLGVWRRDPVAVAAGSESYAVEVGRGLVAERVPELTQTASLAVLVSDTNVEPLHGASVRAALGARARRDAELILEPGERHKQIGSIERIWRAALAAGADRKSYFVGLGGGVVTDMTGFAAASFLRGVRWIGLPTTLLAMVDASVGGKTGVDLEQAKNAVGAFWQPSGVLCDVDLEATEPERGYVSALAEVVKTAIIGDATLLDRLEAELPAVRARAPELVDEMVRRSVRVKARIVSFDERESGLRAVLNLGHTYGHALEAEAGFERLTHGEAVALGLVAALRAGERLGHTPKALAERVTRLLAALGLPTELERGALTRAAELLGLDKKRAGKKLKFVVARDAGRVETVDIEVETLRRLAPDLA